MELLVLLLERLRWYGHVGRRDENYIGRKMLELEVPGRRRRGRPKKRWRDCIEEDLREKKNGKEKKEEEQEEANKVAGLILKLET